MGITSLATSWLGLIGLVFGIIGLVRSSAGKKSVDEKIQHKAQNGFIMSLIGTILAAIFMIGGIVASVGAYTSALKDDGGIFSSLVQPSSQAALDKWVSKNSTEFNTLGNNELIKGVTVKADGDHTAVITLTYGSDITDDMVGDMQGAMSQELDDMGDTFTPAVKDMKNEGVHNPVLKVVFQTSDGTLIASKNFTENQSN